MSTRSDTVATLTGAMMPDQSRVSFNGTIGIARTTLTIYRNSRRDEAATFVGVCSTPFVQFYRTGAAVILMRGSSLLFDNAANAVGIPGAGAKVDDSSSWSTLSIKFDSMATCDRAVEALLRRKSEEVFHPPFPVVEVPPPASLRARSSRASSSIVTRSSSYNRHNEFRTARSSGSAMSNNNSRNSSNHRDDRDDRNGDSSQRKSSAGGSSSSARPASTRISERQERHESAIRSDNTRGPTLNQSSSASSVTATSSRLPSRRHLDDDATSVVLSRLPSRREHDGDASSRASAIHSISSARRIEDNTTNSNLTETPLNGGSSRHASTSKRRERRPVDPIEREFRADRQPIAAARPRAASSGSKRTATTAAAEATESPYSRRSHTAASTPGARSSRTSSRQKRRESGEVEDNSYMGYSNSVTPRSMISGRAAAGSGGDARNDQEQFMRTVQRMNHHRLHFMSYLHKEMVHQAYLAEESKVKAAMTLAAVAVPAITAAAARTPSSHRRAASTNSSSAVATEEASRLREIESRMAQVEALHREAEREREAAARLRREYEFKIHDIAHPSANNNASKAAAATGGGRRSQHSRDASDFAPSSQHSPSRRRGSGTTNSSSGQVVVVPEGGDRAVGGYQQHHGYGSGALMPYAGPALLGEPEPDIGISIVDRYIFGDEWDRLFPSQEVDVRFNAQIDVCLALRMPRERVTITNLVVDQPGLRVTAEISHDHNHLARDVIERRINGSPFRFLQRMYEMRDLFDPNGADAGSGPAVHHHPNVTGSSSYALQHQQRRPSSSTARGTSSNSRAALITSGSPRRGSSNRIRFNNTRGGGAASDYDNDEDGMDVDGRRRELHKRQDDRARKAADRLARRKRELGRDVRHHARATLAETVEEEERSRRHVQLAEATVFHDLMKNLRRNTKGAALESVTETEAIDRATIEVGAARQFQTLVGAHRRLMQAAHLVDGERQRRQAIMEQQTFGRHALNSTMNPAITGSWGQLSEAERTQKQQQRERDAARRSKQHQAMDMYKAAAALEALDDVVADERAARAALMTDAMTDWLDILYGAPTRGGTTTTTTRGSSSSGNGPAAIRQMLAELTANEAADRATIEDEERRRRRLYATERAVQGEAIARDGLEGDELAARGAILDQMVQQGREDLQRRINDREQLQILINEEQFYRATIIADEQDAFEVLCESFADGLRRLMNRPVEDGSDEEWLPSRKYTGPREAKPFHYMTFSPEDMDFPPSAVLAIEGILGCSINKNLEVTRIACPLPKAESEQLEFQAGDMILDVAGHSLHSLSHLREVLSARAMQIQGEATEEFPDVPAEQTTTAPALQKYIDVLCEHHNFLVQVLRGCDIFQIIVKS